MINKVQGLAELHLHVRLNWASLGRTQGVAKVDYLADIAAVHFCSSFLLAVSDDIGFVTTFHTYQSVVACPALGSAAVDISCPSAPRTVTERSSGTHSQCHRTPRLIEPKSHGIWALEMPAVTVRTR